MNLPPEEIKRVNDAVDQAIEMIEEENREYNASTEDILRQIEHEENMKLIRRIEEEGRPENIERRAREIIREVEEWADLYRGYKQEAARKKLSSSLPIEHQRGNKPWKCVSPYDRSQRNIRARVNSCQKTGNGTFSNRQLCVNSCYAS